jgi:hypothetical protein
MNKTMQMLLATTALVGYAGMAMAGNAIYIDESGAGPGGQNQLTIDQSSATGSTVGGSSTPFTVKGNWAKISITQKGSGNTVTGTGGGAPTIAQIGGGSYVENDTGGGNTHTVTAINAAGHSAGTVAAFSSSDGTGAQATMNGGGNSLTDNLTTNIASGSSGNINYTAALLGASNTVTNTITGADSIALNVNLAGAGNTVTNHSTGSGNKVISVSLANPSAGSTVTNEFNDTTTTAGDTAVNGNQTSVLSADSSSQVNYTLTSTTAGNVANVSLNNVAGASGAAGIYVAQSGTDANSIGTASYSYGSSPISGTAFSITGAVSATAGSTLSNSGGTTTGGNAVVILQTGGAVLSGNVTGTGSNYAMLIKQ